MIKPKFKIGDIVNLLPYNDFIDHWGILEPTWNEFFKLNPHTIRSVNTLTGAITYFLEAGTGFMFPEHSFKTPYKLPDDLFEI